MSRPPFVIRHLSFVILLIAMTPLAAQTPGGGNPGGPPGGFDPAAIHDRILARFKTALDPSDDEWKLIEPKLTKVVLLQLDVAILPGMMNRGGGRGGFNIRSFVRTILDPNAQPSKVEEKSQELQQLIDSNETSSSAYTNALAQLRKAREKAKEDLTAAQKDLITLLTVRQEAALVQMGILE